MNRQIHTYSIDTSYFYNEKERQIHRKLNARYFYKAKLSKNRNSISRRISKIDKSGVDKYNSKSRMLDSLKTIGRRITILDNEINVLKQELKELLMKNQKQRQLSMTKLGKRDVVSIFDSFLIRSMELKYDKLTHDIIIVKTFYFNVLENIIKDGFTYAGHEFIPFTASAGQIRQKKTVFIKKSVYNKIENKITCGLTVDTINKNGGVNINKYLAYLALTNSATEVWDNFNIRKTIVVDDMETLVDGKVDFIDRDDYSIVRQDMGVPIEHTDGCGMVLPKISKKSFMVRLPWVKGLLVPFPFDKFIREKRKESGNTNIGIITDIYGDSHDILKDDIEVILTKSQFKMWKYYDDWKEYQDKFIQHKCEGCYCNEEPDIFGSAKLNYQMLQTLTDITKEEITELCEETVKDINNIGSDRNTMLKVLGATSSNQNKNNVQKALEIYPELLRDNYSKKIIKDTKASLVKKARAGKIDIKESVYTFLIPDLYAFCEHLFLGIEKPNGLLMDGEVSCVLYENGIDLDCLRSPHLYREHAIRRNIVNKEIRRWFISNGIYTSSHDLISKMLQFDNDGDQSLVVANKLFVDIAKRNMEGIVPLYYEMKSAEAGIINRDNVYKGMANAYKSGNIGAISNNISKIWNSNNVDLKSIKLLCFENNFVIDSAKTLYVPSRPPEIHKQISAHTKNKLPYFFMYAKDKKREQVEKRNKTTVNLIKEVIPNNPINFTQANVGKFDYKMLTSKQNVKFMLNYELIKKYKELDQHKYFMINYEGVNEDNNLVHIYQDIREELLKIESNIYTLVDVLIKYLYKYKKSGYKTTLWECFGDVMIENLQNNITQPLDDGWIMCEVCGKRIEYIDNRKYCFDCQTKKQKEWQKISMKKLRKSKNV